MNKFILLYGLALVLLTSFKGTNLGKIIPLVKTNDSIPEKNRQIIAYVVKNGRSISPTYESSVCTEFVIGVLKHFMVLTKEDKNRIRIITKEDIYKLRRENSSIPKGVFYALTSNGTGTTINNLSDVKPGDLVQFWYENWGHCGIVKSVNVYAKSMDLHSSFPTTNGYGVQTFSIPKECYFVRLR